jgi:NAD(P)-dependent dehydrogenase (short-subunit alcohol dehydrogenase family)
MATPTGARRRRTAPLPARSPSSREACARVALLCIRCVECSSQASGIGLATARQLASRGAAVSIVDLRLEAAEQTARDLTSEYGVPAIGVGCNVAEQAQVEAAVATTVDRLGGVHLALNSAGIPSKGGMFAEYPVDDFVRSSSASRMM